MTAPAKKKGTKTTKTHFKIFKTECERLRKLWHLDDWMVFYAHTAIPDAEAMCALTPSSRQATLSLSTLWWNEPPTPEAMRYTARHEMTHLLLGLLVAVSQERYVSEQDIELANEATCIRVSSLLP